jgi:hypothetical protein
MQEWLDGHRATPLNADYSKSYLAGSDRDPGTIEEEFRPRSARNNRKSKIPPLARRRGSSLQPGKQWTEQLREQLAKRFSEQLGWQ